MDQTPKNIKAQKFADDFIDALRAKNIFFTLVGKNSTAACGFLWFMLAVVFLWIVSENQAEKQRKIDTAVQTEFVKQTLRDKGLATMGEFWKKQGAQSIGFADFVGHTRYGDILLMQITLAGWATVWVDAPTDCTVPITALAQFVQAFKAANIAAKPNSANLIKNLGMVIFDGQKFTTDPQYTIGAVAYVASPGLDTVTIKEGLAPTSRTECL